MDKQHSLVSKNNKPSEVLKNYHAVRPGKLPRSRWTYVKPENDPGLELNNSDGPRYSPKCSEKLKQVALATVRR